VEGIVKGHEYYLYFEPDDIVLQHGDARQSVSYAELASLELSGPGETMTNLGVIGGGHGLLGAIAGMAMSSGANALTTRKMVDTLVTWRTATSEVNLHTSSVGPEALRIELSEVFGKIE